MDTRQYEVEYEDGGTEILSANLLAENLLAQVDEHGHKHLLMEEITDHRSGEEAVKKQNGFYALRSGTQRRRHTTAGWDFYVTWKDGSSNWIPLKDMKGSFPIEVADYADKGQGSNGRNPKEVQIEERKDRTSVKLPRSQITKEDFEWA